MPEQRTARHWIGGAWREIGPASPSINPADGSTIGSYFDGGEAAAEATIEAAHLAFRRENWRADGMA